MHVFRIMPQSLSGRVACLLLIFGTIPNINSPVKLFAQTAKTISMNDGELYLGAITMIGSIHEGASKSSSPAAAGVDATLRSYIGIGPADYSVLLKEYRLEKTTIWKGDNGKALQGASRTSATLAAKKRLSKSMSEKGWKSFRSFVNGKYLQSTQRFQSDKEKDEQS